MRIASVFDVEMVEVSMSNVDMLVVNVFKDGLRRLGTRPGPRVQGPPLSGESAHPRWVRLHWPRATVKMKQQWCTCQEDVAKVQANYAKFIKKEMLRIGEDSDEFQLSYN